jgi:hypothetical protein
LAERYLTKHGGCAIVCGAAPSLFEDLQAARELRPDAVLLGVNNVAAMVNGIEHIWTQHSDHAPMFKSNAPHIKVHARPRQFTNGGGMWFLPAADHKWAAVDYVWPTLTWVGGSSGVAGALWARHGMSFDEVILAGVPLAGSRYAKAYPSVPTKEDGSWAESHQLEQWIDQLRGHQARGKTENIFSMSGRTRDVLGAPA